MRVLQIHNYYQQGGGEDAVVLNERALIHENGNDIDLFAVSNDRIRGSWAVIKAAICVPYSPGAREELVAKIAAYGPDIAHVHNFFPLLTPSVYDACKEQGIPVIQTLHNYRIVCAGALLMRDGRPCEDCIGGSPFQSVLHGCYRDSRPASLAVARMINIHRRRQTWQTKVDRYIALTHFAKSRFVAAGFPPEKISVKPNFVEDRKSAAANAQRRGGLFVGRMSMEKGITTLLRAWQACDVPLRIVGDGPLFGRELAARHRHVDFAGRLDANAVDIEMRRAEFLVLPSEWYEGFPMVLVEAFCQGLPVIASRIGSLPEIVEDGVTGLHFTPGDPADLATKVRWAAEHPDEMRQMGQNARRVYEQKYTPETNYKQLIAIYQAAISERSERLQA